MATIVRRVAAAMEKIAPLRLAEKWDNVSAQFIAYFDLLLYHVHRIGWFIDW